MDINLGWIWGGGGGYQVARSGYVTIPDSDDPADYEWGD
jgi:hypothetical protein